MNNSLKFLSVALASLSLFACAPSSPPSKSDGVSNPSAELTDNGEPKEITVQHCLISFAGARNQDPRVTRTQEEAKSLAEDLMKMVQSGDDFDEIVQQFTNDSAPGIYSMSNFQVASSGVKVTPRGEMVPAFGEVGFKLKVGEYGMAEFDEQKSPFGWHIIKRLK